MLFDAPEQAFAHVLAARPSARPGSLRRRREGPWDQQSQPKVPKPPCSTFRQEAFGQGFDPPQYRRTHATANEAAAAQVRAEKTWEIATKREVHQFVTQGGGAATNYKHLPIRFESNCSCGTDV